MPEMSLGLSSAFGHLPYRLHKILGKGAYGKVFKGSGENGEVVALKEVVMDCTGEGIPLSTLREISVLKKLQRMYDVTIAQKENSICVYIVFEFIDCDLLHFLAKKRQTPGVEFLHFNRIVHRDLKPANLLINSSGTKLKITDFGLSRIVGWSCPLSPEVVTIWYRSPEVLLRSSYFSPCDIWAVGCIIAEMFNCEALFTAKNDIEMLRLILSVVGVPCPDDWPEDALVSRRQFCNGDYINRLSSSVKTNNQNALNLIQSMLQFNPNKRINATEALDSQFFKESVKNVDSHTAIENPYKHYSSRSNHDKPVTRSVRHSMYSTRSYAAETSGVPTNIQSSVYTGYPLSDYDYRSTRLYDGGSQENRKPKPPRANQPLQVDVNVCPVSGDGLHTNSSHKNASIPMNRVRKTARRRTVMGMEQTRYLKQHNQTVSSNDADLVTGNPGDPTYGLASDVSQAVRAATYSNDVNKSSSVHTVTRSNTVSECSPSKIAKKMYNQDVINYNYTSNDLMMYPHQSHHLSTYLPQSLDQDQAIGSSLRSISHQPVDSSGSHNPSNSENGDCIAGIHPQSWFEWRDSKANLIDQSVTDCASNSDTKTSVGEDTHIPWDASHAFDHEEIANIKLPDVTLGQP